MACLSRFEGSFQRRICSKYSFCTYEIKISSEYTQHTEEEISACYTDTQLCGMHVLPRDDHFTTWDDNF